MTSLLTTQIDTINECCQAALDRVTNRSYIIKPVTNRSYISSLDSFGGNIFAIKYDIDDRFFYICFQPSKGEIYDVIKFQVYVHTDEDVWKENPENENKTFPKPPSHQFENIVSFIDDEWSYRGVLGSFTTCRRSFERQKPKFIQRYTDIISKIAKEVLDKCDELLLMDEVSFNEERYKRKLEQYVKFTRNQDNSFPTIEDISTNPIDYINYGENDFLVTSRYRFECCDAIRTLSRIIIAGNGYEGRI